MGRGRIEGKWGGMGTEEVNVKTIAIQLHEEENVILKITKKVKRGAGIIRKLENKVRTLNANIWLV